MADKRIKKLAKLIVNYSLNVKKGERILILGNEVSKEYVRLFSTEIIKKGAVPIVRLLSTAFENKLINSSKSEIISFRNSMLDLAKGTQAVIDIENEPLTSCSPDLKKLRACNKLMNPLWDFLIFDRNNYRRATVLLPLKKEARDANMSEKDFKNYVYNCCFMNWKKFSKKIQKINKLFEKASEVHLLGENINLKFSIKGRNSIIENGKENVPGGELYMAPLKNSLNGRIKFEYPAFRDCLKISGIFLQFKNGKVTHYSADGGQDALKSLLDTDKGARYIGEFGIGINPKADKITKTWIDEKNEGTIHLALGKSYEENNGDNESAVHIDLVKDMHKAKIILDGKVIQENGKWKI